MGFVADDKIPIRSLQFFLNGFVTGQFVEPGDGQRRFVKGVARNGGFKTVIGEDLEAQMEFLEKFVLPLFRKTAGANDKTAPEVAACKEFLDKEAGHDGFARAWVVRKNVTQGQSAQHFLINGGNLMRKRLHIRGMDGEIRVEEMGVVYTPCFRSETELCTVGVETPRQGCVLKR